MQRRVNSFPDGTQSQEQINTDRSRMLTLPDGTVSTVIAGPDRRWGMQAPFVTGLTTTTPGGLALTMAADRTVDLANPADPLSLRSITDKLIINDEFKDKPYTSSYDAAARMFIETTRERRESHTAIDAQARPVRSQIAGLAPVSYTYDTHGRLTTITQGEGESARITALTYNTKGYMDTMTDPLGRTIHFAYDTAGRVTQQTMPDGRVVDYTYDANGNLTNLTPPGRPAHSFTYSPVDLRASYSPPSLGAGTWQTQYLYNADRQITRVTRPDGKIIELGYDSGGRLNTLTTPRGVTTYSYESTTGNLAGIAAPGGSTLAFSYDGSLLTREAWPGPISGTVDRAYDNDFRVISTNLNGSNTISYQYDGDSLLTRAGDLALSRDSQNGLLQGTALGNFTDSWSYNSFGEAIGYRAAYSGGGIFMTQYTYDGLGRITTKSETIGGTTNVLSYTYDLAGHLTAVKQNDTAIASYKYDDNGNRLSFSNRVSTINGTYDDQDRLLQYGPTSYAYTANGELRSKIRDGQTTTYQYDDLGNLIAVSLPNGTQLEYVVDGQNRRIGKKVNGVLIQGFLYQDQLNPIAELDGNGNIVSRFVYASHANAPDYMIKGGVSYRIITDHLGSPRLIVNVTTGEIAQRVDYDEFGNVIEDTNPGFQPFGFAGGIYDQHTKLVRFGVRDYDAETGRWTAKDPVGLEGETTNLYAYVANDPMNWVDPGGMDPCEDVKKMGLARDSAGGVICSGARKIICVWQKSPMPEINECIIEHERSHLEEVNCPQICSFQNYLSLTRPAGKGDECKAYKKQLTCLGRKRSICREPGRTKIQCERFFDFDIGNAKTMMKDLRCYN